LLLAASAPLCACSASLRRGVSTTEAATALEQVTRSGGNELDPAVSPDGMAIAYEVAATPDARPHVEVMTLGAGPRRIEYTSNDVTGFQPAWMHDGSGIVFVTDGGGSPHLVQTAGSGLAGPTFLGDVGNPNLPAVRASPAPDGSTLAMSLGAVELFRTGWRRAA
jgi:Tol biopolymer transport system component